MISNSEFATVRAALRYWRDEMIAHGDLVVDPYRDDASELLSSREEIDTLIERFRPRFARYVIHIGPVPLSPLLRSRPTVIPSPMGCAMIIVDAPVSSEPLEQLTE